MFADHAAHAVLVAPPGAKALHKLPDTLAVGMKDVRTITMHCDAHIVALVKAVAADMRPPIDKQDASVEVLGEPPRHRRAGETGAGNEPVRGGHNAARTRSSIAVTAAVTCLSFFGSRARTTILVLGPSFSSKNG